MYLHAECHKWVSFDIINSIHSMNLILYIICNQNASFHEYDIKQKLINSINYEKKMWAMQLIHVCTLGSNFSWQCYTMKGKQAEYVLNIAKILNQNFPCTYANISIINCCYSNNILIKVTSTQIPKCYQNV